MRKSELTVIVDGVTFQAIRKPMVPGSRMMAYNVKRNGRPFGQIWKHKNTRTTQEDWAANCAIGVGDYLGRFKTVPEALNALAHHK